MKIVVAYKWAPNPQDGVVGSDGIVDWSRAKAAVSEYDPVAAELGRQLADATNSELIGVSVGGSDVASPMAKKAALSRGFDRVVVVADDALKAVGSTETAFALAEAVRQIGDVDLVLAGDSSVDIGAQMVPAILAGALGWPAITNVRSVTGVAGALTIERSHEGGSQILSATGPVVLATASDAVVPRIPGMKDILAAGKKPLAEIQLADLAIKPISATVSITGTAPPKLKARKAQFVEGADVTAVAIELVSTLRAQNVI